MKKKAIIKAPEIKTTALEELSRFLEEKKISLDYKVIPNKIIKSKDGFILVASNVPSIEITAKYADK